MTQPDDLMIPPCSNVRWSPESPGQEYRSLAFTVGDCCRHQACSVPVTAVATGSLILLPRELLRRAACDGLTPHGKPGGSIRNSSIFRLEANAQKG